MLLDAWLIFNISGVGKNKSVFEEEIVNHEDVTS